MIQIVDRVLYLRFKLMEIKRLKIFQLVKAVRTLKIYFIIWTKPTDCPRICWFYLLENFQVSVKFSIHVYLTVKLTFFFSQFSQFTREMIIWWLGLGVASNVQQNSHLRSSHRKYQFFNFSVFVRAKLLI